MNTLIRSTNRATYALLLVIKMYYSLIHYSNSYKHPRPKFQTVRTFYCLNT